MPAFLPVLLGLARAVRHRRDSRLLAGMDERILRDVGLLRTDVLAAPARRLRPASETAACC